MKIICISDTHLQHNIDVPECDILIHSGDATYKGTVQQITQFSNWYKTLKAKHKIFVAGNHDLMFEEMNSLATGLLDKSIIYLQDKMVEIDGIKIYGSPWQPEFGSWAFNLPRGQAIKRKWDMIPEGINILITHGPPQGILDFTPYGNEHAGCEELLLAVERIKPKLHCFGHIHHSYGVKQQGDTRFVNASICDEDYNPTNAPVVIQDLF